MRGMCGEYRDFKRKEEGEELELEGGAAVRLRGGRKARKHAAHLDRRSNSTGLQPREEQRWWW